ncbi:sensor histidine kinase [Mucilaginibacter lacusdianchii]|uniref:sensor histidine kinase n=1 Tax=Mucilaginibacter lacusdianchii TaxID=2684211 RepID=UPI00131EBD1C|nr:HAMP domain-containing sensor histidine kinase [Mucilaginibacter sp. JXJ CY 39]
MNKIAPTSTYLSLLTILLGILGLSGWLWDLPVLYSFLSNGASMKFNTALAILLLGVSSFCFHQGYKSVSLIIYLAIFLFSLTILLEYIFSVDLKVDQLGILDNITDAVQAPVGRMSAFTATCFLLVCTGMQLFTLGKANVAQIILVFCFLLLYSALVGLLLNITGLFQFGRYSGIALPTTLGLSSTTIGLLYASRSQRWLSEAFSKHSASVYVRYAILYFLLLLPIFVSGFIWILKHTGVQPEYAIVVLMLGTAALTFPWAFLVLKKLNRSDARVHNLNQELVFVNKELDSLLHIVSHDLRTPIMSLEGSLELLHRRLETKIEEQDRKLFAIPQKSIKRLRSTIEHLGEIIKAQKLTGQDAEEIDLCALLDDIRVEISETLENTGGQIITEAVNCTIYYKRVHLKSILHNLITNALMFRHPHRSPVIHIQASMVDEGVQLVIADNGLGIPEKNLPGLFLKYRRFHEHVDGTGVGLYLVQQLIGIKGGTIEVQSQEGQGTTFTLFLPA